MRSIRNRWSLCRTRASSRHGKRWRKPPGEDDCRGPIPRLHQGLPGTAAARPGPRTLAADRQPADPPPRDLQLRRRHPGRRHQLKLCRLRYVGSASQWQFAIYRASHDDYDESVFPTGLPVGTCQDALDTACGLYLNDPTAWILPPTNLRARPLSMVGTEGGTLPQTGAVQKPQRTRRPTCVQMSGPLARNTRRFAREGRS